MRRDEAFFGIHHRGRVYFRVDEFTRPRYQERGMAPFSPGRAMTLRSYCEVPLDVLERAAEAVRWAREAVRAAEPSKGRTEVRRRPAPKPPRRNPR